MAAVSSMSECNKSKREGRREYIWKNKQLDEDGIYVYMGEGRGLKGGSGRGRGGAPVARATTACVSS